jgi:hypothetical protein
MYVVRCQWSVAAKAGVPQSQQPIILGVRFRVSGVRKKLISGASPWPGGPIVGLEAYGLEALP